MSDPTVGAADMDKPTVDTPEFRELMCNLGYWVDEDEADNDDCAMRLIDHIDAKLPAAAPADLSVPEDARKALLMAAINCGHSIESGQVTLFRQPGGEDNALKQLGDRLTAAYAMLAAPSLAAPEAVTTLYECRLRHENGGLLDWSPLDVDSDEEAASYMNHGAKGEWRKVAAAPAAPVERPDTFGEEVTRLCHEIRQPCSLAWRDSLFEQLMELIDPTGAAPVERESKAEAVGALSRKRDGSDELVFTPLLDFCVTDGMKLYDHPAAPSEPKAQAEAVAQALGRWEAWAFSTSLDERNDDLCTCIAEIRAAFDATPSERVTPAQQAAAGISKRAWSKEAEMVESWSQEGQQDQAVDALTDLGIFEVWQNMPGGLDGWLKQFGYMQFARAIEAEVQRRCRAQRTTEAGNQTVDAHSVVAQLPDILANLQAAYRAGMEHGSAGDGDESLSTAKRIMEQWDLPDAESAQRTTIEESNPMAETMDHDQLAKLGAHLAAQQPPRSNP